MDQAQLENINSFVNSTSNAAAEQLYSYSLIQIYFDKELKQRYAELLYKDSGLRKREKP